MAAQEEEIADGKGQVPQSMEQIGQWMEAGRNAIEDDMTTMTGVGVKEERGEEAACSSFVPFFNGNFWRRPFLYPKHHIELDIPGVENDVLQKMEYGFDYVHDPEAQEERQEYDKKDNHKKKGKKKKGKKKRR